MRLLAAVLRLADGLDADEKRLPYEACRQDDDIPFKQHIEYYKHEMVQGVVLDPVNRAINLYLLISYEDPIDPITGRPIDVQGAVEASLREEFDHVRGIISRQLVQLDRMLFHFTRASELKTRPKSIGGRDGLEREENLRWSFFVDDLRV